MYFFIGIVVCLSVPGFINRRSVVCPWALSIEQDHSYAVCVSFQLFGMDNHCPRHLLLCQMPGKAKAGGATFRVELQLQAVGWSLPASINIHGPAKRRMIAHEGEQSGVLPPLTGRSRVRVAVSSHCTGEGKACHWHSSSDPACD